LVSISRLSNGPIGSAAGILGVGLKEPYSFQFLWRFCFWNPRPDRF
jgi:hypothetical protein